MNKSFARSKFDKSKESLEQINKTNNSFVDLERSADDLGQLFERGDDLNKSNDNGTVSPIFTSNNASPMNPITNYSQTTKQKKNGQEDESAFKGIDLQEKLMM